ncbi:MAG TPA: DUF1214 domain-containing protein [Mycobacterium sp.]
MTELAELDAAWLDYSDRVKAAGQSITGPEFTDDPRLRAEGYRYVGRLANLAHQIYLEFADTARPALFRYEDDMSTFGAPNMDNNYARAMLEPTGTYRVSGDISGIKELLISVHEGEMALGKPAVLGEVALGDLEVGEDGWLDLIVGGTQGPTNWIALQPNSSYLNIRQFVGDWEHDPIAVLDIERLDDVGPATNVTPASMAVALDRAATWVESAVSFWNMFAGGLEAMTPVNEFLPPRYAQGGADNMVHGGTKWELGPEQALVIEFDEPVATYWSIQMYMLPWLTPLDAANRMTSINDGQVRRDEDGKIRIVMAHCDPGVENWLDTSDLTEGLCSYRWVRARTEPTPVATLVDIAEVRKYLPESTPEFSSDERTAQIGKRHRGVARRFRR